jgi:5-methylthioadenosine/S-adenosylhomocysteine deaminase
MSPDSYWRRLANASGIQSIYRGLIRNVEQPDDPQLPRAGTRIANPDAGKAREYLEILAANAAVP